MAIEYKGFEIVIGIEEGATTWVVYADVKKTDSDLGILSEFPRIKETFPREDGALNSALFMEKKVKGRIDNYLQDFN